MLANKNIPFLLLFCLITFFLDSYLKMSFSNELIYWYKMSSRSLPWRNTTDPYPIWLSEVMLQQTKVEQGLPYFHKFMDHFPTIADLAKADEQLVLKLWQGLGYYSRARNLHAAARHIHHELGGKFPDSVNELLKIKGIGPYTAAAIASFAFQRPSPVIDGNVERVLARYLGIKEEIKSAKAQKILKDAAHDLIDKDDPATFNQAIMELGALVCTPRKADCHNCPIQSTCYALENDCVQDLPFKKKKKKAKEIRHNYLVFEHQRNVLIEKRESGIWKNMYQFPLIEGDIKPEQLHEVASNYAALNEHAEIEVGMQCTHILSHRKINAHFYTIKTSEPLIPLKSHIFEIEFEELEDKYPVSVLIDK